MQKKVTNEEVGQIIGKVAEKVRSDMDYEFRVAQSQMWIAENDLIDALDKKQYGLYKDYSEKERLFSKSQRNFTKGKFNRTQKQTAPYSQACEIWCGFYIRNRSVKWSLR